MSMDTIRKGLTTLSFTLAACVGSAADGAAQFGTFTANVTGAATAQFQGMAVPSGDNAVGWMLQFMEDNGSGHVMIQNDVGGRPGPGTYALVDFTTAAGGGGPPGRLIASLTLDPGILPGGGFESVSGTITIDSSATRAVVGSFTITAAHSGSPASAVTVTGTFDASSQDGDR